MLLTSQVQVTLVAPWPTTRSWKRRQAATSWGLRPQAYQPPFISHHGAKRKGWPQAFASCAHFLIFASWLPLTTASIVVPLRPIVTSGIAPRALVASTSSLSKVVHDCPWLRIAIFLPAWRSNRSQACVFLGALPVWP